MSVSTSGHGVGTEDGGGLGGEDGAIAVYQGDIRAIDLPMVGAAPELSDGLDGEEDAVHPGVGVGQAAAVGVDRQVPAGANCS